MNRIVFYGLTSFFALVGICVIGGPKEVQAYHGWLYDCGCQGWHPWHAKQRCYSCSGCSGCYGCCSSAGCCASRSGYCYSYQGCYGCYGGRNCQGVIYHSCYGCYGGCAGYYPSVAPAVVEPVEPAPSVSLPTATSRETSTFRIYPAADSATSYFPVENTIATGDVAVVATEFDAYIHEPR